MPNLIGVSDSGGTPTTYTITTLRGALRKLVGQGISPALLTNDEIDECLEDARVELNRKKPLYSFLSFNTVAGQQCYTATQAGMPTNWIKPPRIFWSGGAGGCSSLGLFANVGLSDPMNWIVKDIFENNGSNLRQDQFRIGQAIAAYTFLFDRFAGKGWMGEDERVWLSPVPSSVETVYYFVGIPRFLNVLTIDERFRSAFFAWAEHRACQMLMQKQGEVAGTTGDAGKKVTSAGGARYEKQADKAEARFKTLTNAKGGISVLRGRR